MSLRTTARMSGVTLPQFGDDLCALLVVELLHADLMETAHVGQAV
jgi:hypothetical protein